MVNRNINQKPISNPRTRTLRIIAQDPSIKIRGRIITSLVEIPAEELAHGPWGYRVHVIDYDSSKDVLYAPLETDGDNGDKFEKSNDKQLLENPGFHAQNVYGIVMRTLARFEFALGRHVSWSFPGHQLKIAPHAFLEANAFYSKVDQAIFFGYFQGKNGMVFSSLSHDVVAHECTHAILDGLRERYIDPSSPDQASFHEGFADIVALLSVFSLKEVTEKLIDLNNSANDKSCIDPANLTIDKLRNSALLKLAEEMGQEMSGIRGSPLRNSANLLPDTKYLFQDEFMEPHRRGEILVAAVINSFLQVWLKRLEGIGQIKGFMDKERVVEEGASAAEHLLNIAIRAIDYTPPVDLSFGDFLSALLTADLELVPDDSKYQYRAVLLKTFGSYGIKPSSKRKGGLWEPPEGDLIYDRTHFEPMQRDPDEMFRFIWENRQNLCLNADAYTRVLSVRPCMRRAPDGFFIRETVGEYIQMIDVLASELHVFGIRKPARMPDDQEIKLYGGGALIFDEYGRLKYHIHNRITNSSRQTNRLKYLWDYGYFLKNDSDVADFSEIHRCRSLGFTNSLVEGFNQ